MAKATTHATFKTAVLGAKTGFYLARGWCDVSSKAVEGAVRTLPMFSRISPLVNSTHSKMSELKTADASGLRKEISVFQVPSFRLSAYSSSLFRALHSTSYDP
eukprot:8966395-Pyramimonas_sp.AAC.1